MKSALKAVRRDLAVLAEKDVPTLINESAVSQVIPILTGDYNLKLARQDYFTSNQGQVIQIHFAGNSFFCEYCIHNCIFCLTLSVISNVFHSFEHIIF